MFQTFVKLCLVFIFLIYTYIKYLFFAENMQYLFEALRVFPAVTRLTVYRRLRVLKNTEIKILQLRLQLYKKCVFFVSGC